VAFDHDETGVIHPVVMAVVRQEHRAFGVPLLLVTVKPFLAVPITFFVHVVIVGGFELFKLSFEFTVLLFEFAYSRSLASTGDEDYRQEYRKCVVRPIHRDVRGLLGQAILSLILTSANRYNLAVTNLDPESEAKTLRNCFCAPIAEIADAARYLDAAVSGHLVGRRDLAEQLIRLADIPAIRDWTESLWGRRSPYVHYRPSGLKTLPRDLRLEKRMPTAEEQRQLHLRDGYYCRFCGIPVIRSVVRNRIRASYPNALRWGKTNADQHTGFQAMWAQYDHLLPHAYGGTNDLDNVVVTCAPCNFARMDHLLEDVLLNDPRTRPPVRGSWDGLERFHRLQG
jgi:5-methylcytosine-specific restriction endonuclease McrA